MDDPSLWIELNDCWVQELLAAERGGVAVLNHAWQKTRRALVSWRPCLLQHGATSELLDHLLDTKPLNGPCTCVRDSNPHLPPMPCRD